MVGLLMRQSWFWNVLTLLTQPSYQICCHRTSTSSGNCCWSPLRRRWEVFLLLGECNLHDTITLNKDDCKGFGCNWGWFWSSDHSPYSSLLSADWDWNSVMFVLPIDRNQMKPCTVFPTTVGHTIWVKTALVFTLTNHSPDSSLHPNWEVWKTLETIWYGVTVWIC